MNVKFFCGNCFTGYTTLAKSILDRLVAARALLVLSPVLLLIAVAIYICMGRCSLYLINQARNLGGQIGLARLE